MAQSLPPCWALPGCTDTYAYKTGETFLYAMPGGNVPFYAEDMPGAAQWWVEKGRRGGGREIVWMHALRITYL